MIKKILVAFVAAAISVSLICMPVHADGHSLSTNIVKQIERIIEVNKEYSSGTITLEEYDERMDTYVGALGLSVVGFSGVNSVIDVLDALGVDVSDYWQDYYGNNMGGAGGGGNRGEPSFDMDGAGAVLVSQAYTSLPAFRYGSYGVIIPSADGKTGIIQLYDIFHILTYSNGRVENDIYLDTPVSYSRSLDISSCIFYGDWRYSDGILADDITSEIIYTIPPLEVQDEDTIYSFLDDLINQLKLQYPDLSTIEGLLSAIYNRLGSLDSDNDNDLLAQVLTAIQALEINGGVTDNSEILQCLQDIKSSLVYGEDETNGFEQLANQLKTLVDNQITVDDFTIDEELYNQRGEVLTARIQGKFAFAQQFKDFITYIVDSYANSSDTPVITLSNDGNSYDMDFSIFDKYMPLFRAMLVAFIYGSYAWHTYRKIPSYINGGDNE